MRILLPAIMLVSLLLSLVPSGMAADMVKPPLKWVKHNSLMNKECFKADWDVTSGGRFRIENSGIRLLNDTHLISRFRVSGKGQMTMTYTEQNRNVYLTMWGETIELRHVGGVQTYQLDVSWQADKIAYKLMTHRISQQRVGQGRASFQVAVPKWDVLATNAIQLADMPTEPTNILIGSHRISIPGANQNVFEDMFLVGFVVSGPVEVSGR